MPPRMGNEVAVTDLCERRDEFGNLVSTDGLDGLYIER